MMSTRPWNAMGGKLWISLCMKYIVLSIRINLLKDCTGRGIFDLAIVYVSDSFVQR